MLRSLAAVFFLLKPDPERIERFLADQRHRTFSYREVGYTRRGAPPGYRVDHNRVRPGEGRATFARAVDAIRAWRTFDFGWSSAHPAGDELVPGLIVAARF